MSILIYEVDDEIKFDLNWQGWGFVFAIFFFAYKLTTVVKNFIFRKLNGKIFLAYNRIEVIYLSLNLQYQHDTIN